MLKMAAEKILEEKNKEKKIKKEKPALGRFRAPL